MGCDQRLAAEPAGAAVAAAAAAEAAAANPRAVSALGVIENWIAKVNNSSCFELS